MGLGSILGSIAGLVAAPFTGGASMIPGIISAAAPAVGGIADVLGGASKSAQASNEKKDQLKLLLENARLNRDKFATQAPQDRLKTAVRGSFASSAQPSSVSWGGPGSGLRGEIPKFSGGVHGALANLSPEARQLGGQVGVDALLSQMKGGASAPGGGTDAAMPTDIGQSSGLDKVLGGGSLISSILAAVGKNLKPKGADLDPYGYGG